MEEPARAAVLRLGALARLARAHVLGDVDVLAHPEGEAAYQRPCLGASEVAAERAVVALAKYLRTQATACRDAKTVSLALAAAVQQAAADQERPAFRRVGGVTDGGAVAVNELSKCRCGPAQDGPENHVDGQLRGQSLNKGR